MKRLPMAALLLALCAVVSSSQDTIPPWRGNFERYRLNYVVAGFTFEAQVKFQVSIRYRVFDRFPLYFAYSQRSFWDLYDWQNSTPFRESNYMPELFYRLSGTEQTVLRYLQFGVEHESNGRSGPSSRSWNKIVIQTRMKVIENLLHMEPRFWIPFAIAAENRDIRTYLGFAQWTFIVYLFPDPVNNHLELTIRPGFDDRFRSFSYMANLMIRPLTSLGWDVFGANPFLMMQLWHGYGESLIDYNMRTTRFRMGFTF